MTTDFEMNEQWLSDAHEALTDASNYAGLLAHVGSSELEASADDLAVIETGLVRAHRRLQALLDEAEGGGRERLVNRLQRFQKRKAPG
jgi:hypothetical protein